MSIFVFTQPDSNIDNAYLFPISTFYVVN